MDKKLFNLLQNIEVLSQVGESNPTIAKIVFDSRLVTKGSLFVAVSGTKVDGHTFIAKAIADGAVAIICEVLPSDIQKEITYIVVKSSSLALGYLASAFYNHPSSQLKLVGVTGTNGKTTTATLLYHLVKSLGYKAGLFSTVVNYIGGKRIEATHTTPDPIALNELMNKMVEAGCDYCFMEVSSHSVAQHRIAGLEFDGAIFTNLTHDHLDYHLTFDAYRDAKKAFFDTLSPKAFALTNIDDVNGKVMVQNSKAKIKSYSLRDFSDFKVKIIEETFDGMQLTINDNEVWTPFIGRFNAQNLLAVYGAAILLGFDKQEVLIALSQLHSVDGRFETVRSGKGITGIVDYAHTPDAVTNVIKTIQDLLEGSSRLITVIGAGGDRDKSKRPIMAAEAVKGSDIVILTADNPRSEDPEVIINEMVAGVAIKDKSKVFTITNRKEAIRMAVQLATKGDVVLVAGKGHETYQEIKGVKHHFDDKEELLEAFKNLV